MIQTSPMRPMPSTSPRVSSLARADGLQPTAEADPKELRKNFNSFVGETFFAQMLGAMRKTVGKSAYFDGGRGEEVFRGQLDQMLASKMSEASADQFTGPMFELFNLQRPS